jgi:uncharacterized protein YndB with AHSA1/START domain
VTLPTLSHTLDRTVVIGARPETVFRYFTDSARWAAWWGAGSTVDPRPGGRIYIRHPNAVEAAGEVVEIDPPHRIVFTFGFLSGNPIPEGGSRVTIALAEDPRGTRLALSHEFAEAGARDHHVQGWRYQLAVFANVVADRELGGAEAKVDTWFAAWSEADAGRRTSLLDQAVAPGVRFRDRFSLVEGRPDLDPHLAAVHVFMPGTRLERAGDVRHCQGTVLADWVARRGDGGELGRGTNVFQLDAEGRIADVVGIWAPAGR